MIVDRGVLWLLSDVLAVELTVLLLLLPLALALLSLLEDAEIEGVTVEYAVSVVVFTTVCVTDVGGRRDLSSVTEIEEIALAVTRFADARFDVGSTSPRLGRLSSLIESALVSLTCSYNSTVLGTHYLQPSYPRTGQNPLEAERRLSEASTRSTRQKILNSSS